MTFRFEEKIGCQTDEEDAAIRVVCRKPVEASFKAGAEAVCTRQAATAWGKWLTSPTSLSCTWGVNSTILEVKLCQNFLAIL